MMVEVYMKNTQSFEASVETLEKIISDIESPATPLDESIDYYKAGIALAKRCGEVLSGYEAEVLLLQREADGVFSFTPFDEDVSSHDR
jgi:exodeoxyribonuclease VII small subunit